MALRDKLKQAGVQLPRRRTEPLWKGPEADGITYSLLSRFLVCRERFRLLVVEGLRPADAFEHRIEFGHLWHACEEALAGEPDRYQQVAMGYGGNVWDVPLKAYAQELCRRYPLSQEAVEHWYNVVKVTFPRYVAYWLAHPDVAARRPLLEEQVFNVPYKLPSGRVVRLRGKWDSVDLVEGPGPNAGVWLQENKTKSDVREEQLRRQLTFDLQTMLYRVALGEYQTSRGQYRLGGQGIPRGTPLRGVRYNVIRRPLGGGRGSIVRHKPTKSNPAGESKEAFYARLGGIIDEDPGYFFMRWNVEVSDADVARFRHQCLDPLLEQLCDWWHDQAFLLGLEEQSSAHLAPSHWRHPYGVYNVLDAGGSTDLDAYLADGSEVGLTRVDRLFTELE